VNISFSGASCGGKTSQIQLLNKDYDVYADAGMVFIERHLIRMSAEEFLRWRAENNYKYYSQIISYQSAIEKKIESSSINIFDRSVLDYIALHSLESGKNLSELSALFKFVNIDHAFIFYPLNNFDRRVSTGRLLDKERSFKLSEKMKALCSLLNINFDIIPLANEAVTKDYISQKLKSILKNEYQI
jgi:hypothetical protein